MSELIVPNDRSYYPTLGPEICELMEAALVFGPGDLLGKPYVLDDEDRALIYHAYEVYPRGHELAGRRCYDLVTFMMAKGTKKSERGAAFAAAELHPEAPVRFDGWRGRTPVGRPVASPYIPIVAYSEKQAEDTSFSKMRAMIADGRDAHLFDIGLDRILRLSDGGKAEALSSSPDSRDGGLTTFEIEEETHRWTLPRQHETHATMSANLTKRPIAEPWGLQLTTGYRPGEGSVAEEEHDEAVKLSAQPIEKQRDARRFFFYRWADEKIKIRDATGQFDESQVRVAVVDALGPIASRWKDPPRIARELIKQERIQPGYGERVFLNRAVKAGDAAFDIVAWKKLAKRNRKGVATYTVAKGALITLGWDGSKVDDWSACIATEVATGFQWPIGIWDPLEFGGQIPRHIVDVVVDQAFEDYEVWRMYADPPYWKDEIAGWQGKYGEKTVIGWETWRPHPMGFLVRNYVTAITSGELSHDGDPVFTSHIGNSRKRLLSVKDDKGERLFTIAKERDGSPHKVDAAVAGGLSWAARTDAIKSGAVTIDSVYEGENAEALLSF